MFWSDNLSVYIFYSAALIALLISYKKDKKKTKVALKKASKSFGKIFPQFLGVIMLVGIVLSILNTEVVSNIMGTESGWIGVIIASVVGAITLIPGFISFPMAALLLESGAGYMQIGSFISSLMMVGIVTASVEAIYFGKRLTIYRNLFAFLFSFIVALVIGQVMILL